MTNPEHAGSAEFNRDDVERAGEIRDITPKFQQLQDGLIDYLAEAAQHPEGASISVNRATYVDEVIGRDLSKTDWLSRGDELTISGNVSLVLADRHDMRYFINLGSGGKLHGRARAADVAYVPVPEGLPDRIESFDTPVDLIEEWSVVIELSGAVAEIPHPDPTMSTVENLGAAFRVFLPLAYPGAHTERFTLAAQ